MEMEVTLTEVLTPKCQPEAEMAVMEEVEEPPLAPLWVTLAVVLAVDPEDALNPMVRCSGPASLQKWVSPRLQNLQRQFQSGVSPSSRKQL